MSTETVKVNYYAAAGAAAGTAEEQVSRPATLRDLKTHLTQAHPELGRVLAVSSLLLDGVVATKDDTPLSGVTEVDVLPPFAGG